MNKPKKIKSVENCTDYKVLGFLSEYNRPVETSNVNEKIKKLEKYGFIGDVIALRTSAFGKKNEHIIAEGQHRLIACEKLNIPFDYKLYEFDKADDTEDNVICFIADFNSCAVNWSNEKYLNAFKNRGKSEYITMFNTLKETGLTTTDFLNIFLFGAGKQQIESFRSGKMKFSDVKKSKELLKAILMLKEVTPNKSYVRRSLFKIFKISEMSITKLSLAIKNEAEEVQKKFDLPENEKLMFEWLQAVEKKAQAEK